MNTIYRCVSLCLLFFAGAAISVANAQDVFLEGGSIQIARALKMGRESSSSIYSSSSTLSTKSAKKKSDLQKVVCPAHSVCNSKGRITGCETGYGLAPDYQGGSVCVACDKGCVSCSGRYPALCNGCLDGYMKEYLPDANGAPSETYRCVKQCSQDFHTGFDAGGATSCYPCKPGCKGCTGRYGDFCASCGEGYKKEYDVDGNGNTLESFHCVACGEGEICKNNTFSCAEGYYAGYCGAGKSCCGQCPSGCKSCSGRYGDICSACADGYKKEYYADSDGIALETFQCVKTCSSGYKDFTGTGWLYPGCFKKCPLGCKYCESNGRCHGCTSGYKMSKKYVDMCVRENEE